MGRLAVCRERVARYRRPHKVGPSIVRSRLLRCAGSGVLAVGRLRGGLTAAERQAVWGARVFLALLSCADRLRGGTWCVSKPLCCTHRLSWVAFICKHIGIRGHVIHVEAIYRKESIGMSDRPTNFACLSSFVVRCCSGVQRRIRGASPSVRAVLRRLRCICGHVVFRCFLLRCSQIHCHSRVICNLADVEITSPANVAR